MLADHFFCGIESHESAKLENYSLVCTKRPSEIAYCFEANIKISITWPHETLKPEELFEKLREAKVNQEELHCTLPPIESKESI